MNNAKIHILDRLTRPMSIGELVDDVTSSEQILSCRRELAELEARGYVLLTPELSVPYNHLPMWLDVIRGTTFIKIRDPLDADRIRANGFTIPTTEIVLAADNSDVDQFTRLLSLLSTGLSAGLITPASSTRILDINKVEHILPASSILSALLQYGVWLKSLWDGS